MALCVCVRAVCVDGWYADASSIYSYVPHILSLPIFSLYVHSLSHRSLSRSLVHAIECELVPRIYSDSQGLNGMFLGSGVFVF